MTTAFSKPILIAGATMLAVSLGSLSAAAQNTNTTVQEGRVCVNRTFQSGESNDNATEQSCRINVNRTIQIGGSSRNSTGQFGRFNRNSTTQGWELKRAGFAHRDLDRGESDDHKFGRRDGKRRGGRDDD